MRHLIGLLPVDLKDGNDAGINSCINLGCNNFGYFEEIT